MKRALAVLLFVAGASAVGTTANAMPNLEPTCRHMVRPDHIREDSAPRPAQRCEPQAVPELPVLPQLSDLPRRLFLPSN